MQRHALILYEENLHARRLQFPSPNTQGIEDHENKMRNQPRESKDPNLIGCQEQEQAETLLSSGTASSEVA